VKPKNRLRKRLWRENWMWPKLTPKENLNRDAKLGWHGRAPRHSETMPKIWHNRPRPAQGVWACCLERPNRAAWQGRATWHGLVVPSGTPMPLVLVWAGCARFLAQLCYVCSIPWGFHATLFRSFKLTFLAFLSTKCRSCFRFFDKVPKNIKRCYMSKKYAKGG